ncbi:hypothetical protein [uncultured Mitsuokella sp.]|uniref:hypothetical protein n=1 Tax=uncultured Mitsuokella sp. TaxID=453120 RepID=UPI0026172D5A|nr:hypothetical protein [uncultured Mitsuokella sp.]
MEEKQERAQEKKPVRGNVTARRVGAAVLLLALVAGGVTISRLIPHHEAAMPVAKADIGMVDMERVLAAHPDYARLKMLRAQHDRILADTNPVRVPLVVAPPETDAKPFEDAVWQKNAQAVIGARAELERERTHVEQAYRKEHDAAYEAQKEAIDAEYLNAILNINLKLDNQSAMHHPWDKPEDLAAERAQWEAELDDLKMERGRRQMELLHAYETEIAAYVQKVLGPKIAAWHADRKTMLDAQKTASMREKTEVQDRNAAAMQAQMAVSTERQKRLAERESLQQVEREIQTLETHIFNDIAGRAAKVAILHHFTLILASHAETKDYQFPRTFRTGAPPIRFCAVIGTGTEDVTDELLSEMQGLEALNTSEKSSE